MTPPLNDPHTWLDTDAIRRASDIALGVITLLIGALFLWSAIAAGYADRIFEDKAIGPWTFPSVVAGLLCVVAVLLLLRAALRRSPPVRGANPIHTVIVVAVIVALSFAGGAWLVMNSLSFGPAEFMALSVLQLALVIALAHSSRLRAIGLVLLGLLLSTIGLDAITGVVRFTMDTVELLRGIDTLIVLIGLFLVGDAIVCLTSVPLFFRTYMRLITGWRSAETPAYASLILRLAAGLILVTAPFVAYSISNAYGDIAWVFVFGILGAAAKIFAWNRFLLYLGFAFSVRLEENIRSAMMMTPNNPWAFLQEPISCALLVIALFVLAGAAALSIRRAVAFGKNLSPRSSTT